MKIILCFCLLIYSASLAQTTGPKLRGVVTEQNSGNKPLSQAQVKADFANATVTDNQGKFLLLFFKKPPGEDIALSIGYKDWVVVNADDLLARIPDNPDRQVLKLYMCPASRLDESRMNYYNISEKFIAGEYQTKISKLNKQNADYAAKVKELESERDALLKQSYDLADRFARLNFDVSSSVQKQAFEQFKEGKIREAIKTLESVNSQEIIAQAQKEKQKWLAIRDTANIAIANADSVLQQSIQKLFFQADIYTLNLQFDQAANAYETAALADTTIFENLIRCGKYFQQQNKFDRAVYWYMVAQRNSKYDGGKAYSYFNLGSVYLTMKEFGKAETNLNNALPIYRQFAKENPAVYDMAVVDVLDNLGSLYKETRAYDKAEKTYLEALKIMEANSKRDADNYLPRIAVSSGNLANVYTDTRNYADAEKYYLRALEIEKKLAAKDPAKYDPYLAVILGNLGNVYKGAGRLTEARQTLVAALRLQEKLASQNPDAYSPDLAIRLGNLGAVYADVGNLDSAEYCYNKAIEIQQQLASKAPQAYEPFLAMLYGNRASANLTARDFSAAASDFEKAISIQQRLAKSNPETFEPFLAFLLGGSGNVNKETGHLDKAEDNYLQALAIQKKFAKNDMNVYGPDLAHTFINLAWVCKAKIEISYSDQLRKVGSDYVSEAIKILNGSPAIPSVMQQKDQCDYLRIYFKSASTSSIIQLGRLQQEENTIPQLSDDREKLKRQGEVVNQFKLLLAEPVPVATPMQLDNAYGNLSWYLIISRQFAEGETAAREGLRDSILNWINTNLAVALLYQDKYVDAEKIYKKYMLVRLDENRLFRDAFLEDLNELEKRGITHPDVSKIRKLIETSKAK